MFKDIQCTTAHKRWKRHVDTCEKKINDRKVYLSFPGFLFASQTIAKTNYTLVRFFLQRYTLNQHYFNRKHVIKDIKE
mgnify:CR=1 FL=1